MDLKNPNNNTGYEIYIVSYLVAIVSIKSFYTHRYRTKIKYFIILNAHRTNCIYTELEMTKVLFFVL